MDCSSIGAENLGKSIVDDILLRFMLPPSLGVDGIQGETLFGEPRVPSRRHDGHAGRRRTELWFIWTGRRIVLRAQQLIVSNMLKLLSYVHCPFDNMKQVDSICYHEVAYFFN